ncbi:hypothetical protein [Bacillus thuringiensis]|uniref:hypothetical protein n=1 Tax=Bacillus thuringiensis TaxID=1428 RepID=UPI000BFA5D90|nr:hypothetical protein [Bacillus thuringiensis]PFP06542.1 hypothetical protein COJ91_12970 [Bacillus thuringiensis]PGP54034.1 hypothetical protein CN992_13115 [Bacillus thuringiensis]PGY60629.1 hypothetical protein COE24_06445 [Bacillus thuringiensis]HDR7470301.1 hypothetical protein [Bacillus toyonensis]
MSKKIKGYHNRINEPTLSSRDKGRIYALEDSEFLWTVYIDDSKKGNEKILDIQHRIRGFCPKCKELVVDGSDCTVFPSSDALKHYHKERLQETFNPTIKPKD